MALPALIAGFVGRAGVAAAAGEAAGAAGGAASASATASAAAGTARASASAASQLGQVSNALSQVSVAARQAHDPITKVADAITGRMVSALTLWVGWVEKAAAPIEKLVRVHNPAIADMFVRALQDAYGVIGRMLVPVMNAFTGVMRKVGDVMAGLEPVFRPAIAAIAKLVSVIGNEFVKYVKENAPAFEFLAAAVTRVAEAAAVAVRVLGLLGKVFHAVVNPILRLLGFTGKSFDPNASSVGAAARTAQFVQPRQIADDAIRNALMVGRERQNTPQQALNNIDKNIENIWEAIKKRWAVVEKRAEQARSVGMVVAPVPTLAAERAAKWAFGG